MQAPTASGSAGRAAPGRRPSPSTHDGMRLVGVPLDDGRDRGLLRGVRQRHPLAALPRRHRAAGVPPARGGRPTSPSTSASPRRLPSRPPRAPTVWVHDYQLQLVPQLLRELRPDLRIGFFIHIPFPGYEIFAQLPWRTADRRGAARRRPARLPAAGGRHELPPGVPSGCGSDDPRSLAGCRRSTVRTDGTGRAVPHLDRLRVVRGAGAAATTYGLAPTRSAPRSATREVVLLGVDRLDYTKGILHRLKAYGEVLADGGLTPAGGGAGAGREPEPGARRAVPRCCATRSR